MINIVNRKLLDLKDGLLREGSRVHSLVNALLPDGSKLSDLESSILLDTQNCLDIQRPHHVLEMLDLIHTLVEQDHTSDDAD